MPAVVLIDRISSALEGLVGQPIQRIRQMRFMEQVSPVRPLQVEVDLRTPGEWRMVCTDGGVVVCKGIFAASVSETVPSCPESAGDAPFLDAQPWYGPLPHSGTMRLVRAVQSPHEGLVRTEARVEAGHPLAEDGRLSAWVGLEYAAQLMALQGVMEASDQGPRAPTRAMIVIVRTLQRTGRQITTGSTLAVSARKLMVQGEAAQCHFVMTADGELALSGEFTVLASKTD